MKVRLELVPRINEGELCPTPMVTLQVRDRYGVFHRRAHAAPLTENLTTFLIGAALFL
jgi:hypothetical protein